ncbi:MAG: hypothetical protein HY901_28625, partial [Deltaproteobacteria bacterium]|nr:hypothetical protein [Deltaproteobacteria bacterium]
AYQEIRHPRIPARLRLAPLLIVSADRRTTRLQSYSQYDPLELPNELLEALRCFDSRPTHDALRSIRRRHGLAFGEDLLLKLVDFRVLEDAQPS